MLLNILQPIKNVIKTSLWIPMLEKHHVVTKRITSDYSQESEKFSISKTPLSEIAQEEVHRLFSQV